MRREGDRAREGWVLPGESSPRPRAPEGIHSDPPPGPLIKKNHRRGLPGKGSPQTPAFQSAFPPEWHQSSETRSCVGSNETLRMSSLGKPYFLEFWMKLYEVLKCLHPSGHLSLMCTNLLWTDKPPETQKCQATYSRRTRHLRDMDIPDIGDTLNQLRMKNPTYSDILEYCCV
ncbi:uncharacterized protein LOC143689682 [Tamandua tetradactyla]|uniref:uncharacterized protein LOC143689682 n=1 Tax=Tamandua tetradactyla TaxID=48850 RepID=UPI0040540269